MADWITNKPKYCFKKSFELLYCLHVFAFLRSSNHTILSVHSLAQWLTITNFRLCRNTLLICELRNFSLSNCKSITSSMQMCCIKALFNPYNNLQCTVSHGWLLTQQYWHRQSPQSCWGKILLRGRPTGPMSHANTLPLPESPTWPDTAIFPPFKPFVPSVSLRICRLMWNRMRSK